MRGPRTTAFGSGVPLGVLLRGVATQAPYRDSVEDTRALCWGYAGTLRIRGHSAEDTRPPIERVKVSWALC